MPRNWPSLAGRPCYRSHSSPTDLSNTNSTTDPTPSESALSRGIYLQMNEELVAEFVAGCQKQALEFVESGRSAKRVTISKISRDLIYQSIGEKCPTCDLTLSEPSDRKSTKSYDPIDSSITVEHLLPLDLGGNNSFNNLVPMCYSCNAKARGATQQEFVEALIKENRGKDLSEENKDILNRFVEWSIRTVKSPDNNIDSEFQQYFEVVGKAPRASPTTRMVRIILVERKIAELEVRIQALENTLWKRTMRSIGSFFQRVKSPINAVEKASIEKKASKPQKGDSHKVEKASIEKQAPQPQKENPHNPDFTPEEFSSAILSHKKRSDAMTFNYLYGELIKEEPKYNLKNHKIKPSSYLEEYCSHLLDIEKRIHKNAVNSSYWILEKKNPVKSEKSFHVEKVTPELDGVDKLKRIIKEILSNSNNKISISALGLRFSKKVQSMGFDNKKEFFKQVGIRPNITISTAINEYMSEEVTLEDGHASLNRRD
jgi:5-methylcytosine-specific restriction endonuclease McrA